MRTGLRGIAIALLLTGCVEYDCGEDLVYSPSQHRCVCPDDSIETDGGVCVVVDAGPLECASGASPMSVYDDADGDGYGRPDTEHLACPGTPGTAPSPDDCDDACAACYPGATEVCDGRDNDCTSGADDTFTCIQGTATDCDTTCGSTGVATCAADCTLPATCTPPAETCNSADDDCDGLADEGVQGFGEPIDWSLSALAPRLERTSHGLVLISFGTGGLVGQRIATSGSAQGEPVVLVPLTELVGFDTAIADDQLIVIHVEENSRVMIQAFSSATLAAEFGARNIGTFASVSAVAVAAEGAFVTWAFEDSLGGADVIRIGGEPTSQLSTATLRVRSYFEFSRSTFPSSLSLIGTGTGLLYLAYNHIPPRTAEDPSDDRELFVRSVEPFGTFPAAEGYRVTQNVEADDFPALAWDGRRLIVAYLSSPEYASSPAELRVHTVEPRSSAAWVTTNDIAVSPSAATGLLADPVAIASTARGTLIQYLHFVGVERFEQRVLRLGPALEVRDMLTPVALGTATHLGGALAADFDGDAWIAQQVGQVELEYALVRGLVLSCR